MKTENLEKIAQNIRKTTFKAIAEAGGGHFGGCLSVVEILTALYFKVMRVDSANPCWEDRDRLILSKGHGGPALYVTLAEKGFFPKEWLAELDQPGSRLPKHVDRLKLPGIDFSSGPLGQGLSAGVGMALGTRLDQKEVRIYVVMGDGECNSGQVWEAAMTAAKYKLDSLVGFVDRNCCQIDGPSAQVMPMEPFAAKWESFGWSVITIDGHNIPQILDATDLAKKTKGKPTLIIACTTKGKGISFMENRYEWHSGKLNADQYGQAIADLEAIR